MSYRDKRNLVTEMGKKKKMTRDGVDRISELPDPLIHQILSSFDMRAVIRTSLLSKRWKCVWKSTPFLNFRLKRKSTAPKRMREAFMDFVNRALILRDSTAIHKFIVDCREQLYVSHIFTWVIGALGRNASELCIEGRSLDRSFELPGYLFTSEITVLKLTTRKKCCAHRKGLGYIQMPDLMCVAPRIMSLSLDEVRLPHGNSKGELVMTCPVLKHLNIEYCDHGYLKSFIISTTQLESLYLSYGYKTADCKISIRCPNLKSINHSGAMYKDYALENLSCLVTATFEIMDTREGSKNLFTALTGIRNINFLRLHAWSKSVGDFQDQLEVFPNLKRLTLRTSISVSGVAKFLERLPSIVSLYWFRDHVKSRHEEWDSYFPILSEFCCLKSVEIRSAEGNDDEIVFLQSLLQRAIVLEKLDKQTNTEQADFYQRVSNLPCASSIVSVTVMCPYT